MGLRLKFNLILGIACLLGLAVSGVLSFHILQSNARAEVLHNADIMMESAMAIRRYTSSEIKPLLTLQMKRQFLPQSVPAYAATRNFHGLREKYADYTYKEATLNPINPASRASDWENDVIQWFRNNQEQRELHGTREGATGATLYLAHPIRVSDQSCLSCHGSAEKAPETLVALYGNTNGFGWRHDEVVGAQLVSVPMSVPLARARTTFYAFMGNLVAVFVFVALLLNLVLHRVVIKPVASMSKLATEVSMGALDAPEFSVKGKDEVASLAAAFNRMRRSLGSAMKLLDESAGSALP